MVKTTLNYLAETSERPFYYLYEPPPGTQLRNTTGDRRTVPIHDARDLEPEPSLEREGFALARHETAVENLYNETAIRGAYYPEIEELVKHVTGAVRVLAFDYNVRSATRAERGEKEIRHPVKLVHNDYTEGSGPQRVRDLLDADEAEARLKNRFAVINVWKPLGGSVQESPLAVCDAQSIRPQDLKATDLRNRDRTGEI